MYVLLYATTKGLKTGTTALICKHALHLGGVHLHQLFCILSTENLILQRCAELSIIKLMKKPKEIVICEKYRHNQLWQIRANIIRNKINNWHNIAHSQAKQYLYGRSFNNIHHRPHANQTNPRLAIPCFIKHYAVVHHGLHPTFSTSISWWKISAHSTNILVYV